MDENGYNSAPRHIPESTLAEMLKRENELRLSPETQAEFRRREDAFAQFDDTTGDWIDYVATHLQPQVLREFGFPPDDEYALWEMRTATYVYPQLRNLALYVKFNRAERGRLRAGDAAPNVEFVVKNKPSEMTTLHDLVSRESNRPLLVCATSWS